MNAKRTQTLAYGFNPDPPPAARRLEGVSKKNDCKTQGNLVVITLPTTRAADL
jgi:hypothetical protein